VFPAAELKGNYYKRSRTKVYGSMFRDTHPMMISLGRKDIKNGEMSN
jgi:hypothetical protein